MQTVDGIVSDGPSYFNGGLSGKPDAFSLHRVLLDSYYFAGQCGIPTLNTAAVGISALFAVPLVVSRPNARLDSIKIDVTVAAGAGGTLRLGLYDADPKSLFPTNLLLDTGNTANDAVAAARVFPISFIPVASKLYWAVLNQEVAGGTVRIIATGSPALPLFGVTQASSANVLCYVTNNGGPFAALPAVFPTAASALQPLGSATCPAIAVRFAA